MFTAQHYREVADVLRIADGLLVEDPEIPADALLNGIRKGFGELFALDNPRFDRERFLVAARADTEAVSRTVKLRSFVSEDGLFGAELDGAGLHVRTREARADMWSPPITLR